MARVFLSEYEYRRINNEELISIEIAKKEETLKQYKARAKLSCLRFSVLKNRNSRNLLKNAAAAAVNRKR